MNDQGSHHWGDLADQAANDLIQNQLDESALLPDGDDFPESRTVKGLESRSLFHRLEFRWGRDDMAIIERIRAACNAATVEQFGAVFAAVDAVYESVRVPVLNSHGMPTVGPDGRFVWQTDENGLLLEDWSRLDGYDLEVAIFKLQQQKLVLSVKNNELFQEALFAKHLFNDDHQDAWRSLLDGTQGDRSAFAGQKSREAKYFAFYKFCVWQSCDTLMKEINGLQRIMERIRDWRIRSQQ